MLPIGQGASGSSSRKRTPSNVHRPAYVVMRGTPRSLDAGPSVSETSIGAGLAGQSTAPYRRLRNVGRAVFGLRSRLRNDHPDWVLVKEGGDVVGVAGQHDGGWEGRGHGYDNRVRCADRAGSPGQCSQAGTFACEDFGDVANLTQGDQAVLVEVASVVTGECFGQYYRRDLRWPLTATTQLRQASALTGKCAQPPAVEDQRHALRRCLAEG